MLREDATVVFLKSVRQQKIIELDVIDKLISGRLNEVSKNNDKPIHDQISIEPSNKEFANLTCKQAVMRVLSESNQPLLLKDIASMILKRGYITSNPVYIQGNVSNQLNMLRRQKKVQKAGKLWSIVKEGAE
jgi:hypothetical protein